MKIVRTIGLVLLAILLAGCAGQQLHREGLALMAEGQAEAGLAKLTEATQAAPGNTRYRADLLRSREQTVNRMLAAAASDPRQASQLQARHQAGQTLLTFAEVQPLVTTETIAAVRLRDLRREAERSGRVGYRVYRSRRPIESVAGLTPIAELPPLTGWNIDYYGDPRPEHVALRYVVQEGGPPVSPETGICAFNPAEAGEAYYAVTAVIDGQENVHLGASNSLSEPVRETVGQGVPVLQRTEQPKEFNYVRNPTLHYFVRWESPPNCSVQGKPIDYLVAVPENPAKPAPVGLHLHCWGGSLNGGYGWWYQAEQGHLLLASNQVPYDWWTGYHERYWEGPADKAKWATGVVRPYSQRRLLSFLDWMATRWKLDLTRTHIAGSSMGGSGAPMFAIRHPERIAWSASWVGVHVPIQSPTFRSSYANVYGQPDWNVKFEDGTPAWDYFDDTWYLRRYPQAEIGLIAFSNGKNDGGIGWPQALHGTRRRPIARAAAIADSASPPASPRASGGTTRAEPASDSETPASAIEAALPTPSWRSSATVRNGLRIALRMKCTPPAVPAPSRPDAASAEKSSSMVPTTAAKPRNPAAILGR